MLTSTAKVLFRPLSLVYAPAPATAPITDPDRIAGLFKHWRIRMLASMFFGYGILYFCRKNISGTIPIIGKELGYTNFQLGILGSTLYITYGLGKFLNGVMADRSNVRTFMASGLILSGLANLWFGSLYSLWALALAWGVNGWVQSMGFPPIARGMTIWYEPKGKATRWALWTCSHQAGTAAILAITGAILLRTGNNWRMCFYIPGILCILAGIGCLFTMADTPESKGLPKVVQFEADAKENDERYWDLFVHRVLLNKQLWVIALINLCTYTVRFGTLDWATKFLVEQKGYQPAGAASIAAFMPLFGIAGVLVAGWTSDVIFKGAFKYANAIMLFILTFAMIAFYKSGGGNYWLDFAYLAVIGFMVEGPQSILGGIACIDVGGSARVASSAAGLVGVCGYFGATLSGLGTGFVLDHWKWAGGFSFWIACSAIGFLLCTFCWKNPAKK
jgi:OPA family sugar phosphate sensor protein UhpC-like MFS transporter